LSLIKADAVVDMIGFPDYIKDPQKLKEKYDGVSRTSACNTGGTFQTPYAIFEILTYS